VHDGWYESGRTTKYLVSPADTRPDLLILRLGVAGRVEVRQARKQRATVPNGVALAFVGDDVNLNTRGLCKT
jgi:hypothetical protein